MWTPRHRRALPWVAALLGLAMLAAACSARAYVLYFRLVAEVGATIAISVEFVVTVIAVVVGTVLLGEHLSIVQVLGGAVIIVGCAMVLDLIRRVREEGYTILVVEQNVRQVLKLVDRAYLLEVGRIKMEGRAADLAEQDFVRKAYVGL